MYYVFAEHMQGTANISYLITHFIIELEVGVLPGREQEFDVLLLAAGELRSDVLQLDEAARWRVEGAEGHRGLGQVEDAALGIAGVRGVPDGLGLEGREKED